MVFQLRDSLGDFLRSSNAENPSMPATIQELEKQLGVRLIVQTFCCVPRLPQCSNSIPIGPLVYRLCIVFFVSVCLAFRQLGIRSAGLLL